MAGVFDELKAGIADQQRRSKANVRAKAAESSADALKAVIARWQKGGDKADASYILKAMDKTIANAMTTYAQGMGDKLAVRAANLTLDALRKYDPSRGAAPETYVMTALQRLRRDAARRSEIIHTPEDAAFKRRYLEDKIKKYIDKYNREPSLDDIADMAAMSRKKVESILYPNAVVSTSSTLAEDDQKSMFGSSMLTDDDYNAYVYDSLSNPMDKKIMEWSTGRNGMPILSGIEIAKRLKVTPAAVSQHKAMILEKMSEVRGLQR